jgi:hypothetical protein
VDSANPETICRQRDYFLDCDFWLAIRAEHVAHAKLQAGATNLGAIGYGLRGVTTIRDCI